jgi:mono/diheme cytochrome c family protein
MIVFCLLFAGNAADAASPCVRLKSQPDAWVTAEADALVQASRAAYENDEAHPAYERALDRIVSTIRRCQLSQDEGFVSRYREFVEYIEVASLERQPDHKLGFSVPDKQYFAETRQYVQIPEFLLTPGFLRSVSRYETLDRAKSFLRQLNSSRGSSDQLIFFSYESRHLGTPDNNDSRRRLLIIVPGNAEKGVPDKWVQFGITDPGARVRVRNVSVVSAMVDSDGTYNAYFKDFYRTYRRDGSISINGRWELGYGDDNCVQCHKSGILPIFPVDGSVREGEQQRVLAANQRFLTYGSPRFDKYLDETKFGPGLSSASREDRGRRFGEGFDGTAVAHAMRCAACHSSEGLGAFNWPMDQTVIRSFIKGGQMPLGYTLRVSERDELYKRLIEEYFAIDNVHPGILKSWLLGKLR